MIIKELSNNIRTLRQQNGWTQENVANDLGISVVAYGRIEQGKTDISISRLSQIADCFKIEPAMLLQGVDVLNIARDSQNYQKKDPEIRRLEKEMAEVKAENKLIMALLLELQKKINLIQ